MLGPAEVLAVLHHCRIPHDLCPTAPLDLCLTENQLAEVRLRLGKVRADHTEASSKLRALEAEQSELSTKLGRDYGEGSVFVALADRCFQGNVSFHRYPALLPPLSGWEERRRSMVGLGCSAVWLWWPRQRVPYCIRHLLLRTGDSHVAGV